MPQSKTSNTDRIAELERNLEALGRALTLLVEAVERLDARIGEWDQT